MSVTFHGNTYEVNTQKDLYDVLKDIRQYGFLSVHATSFKDHETGKVVLIMGSSGVGKSTLRKEMNPRIVIHDDKPLLKVKNDKLYVCGHPLSLDDAPYDLNMYLVDVFIYLEKAETIETHPLKKDVLMLLMKHSIGLNLNIDVECLVQAFHNIPSFEIKTNHKKSICENVINILRL